MSFGGPGGSDRQSPLFGGGATAMAAGFDLRHIGLAALVHLPFGWWALECLMLEFPRFMVHLPHSSWWALECLMLELAIPIL